MVLPTPPFPVKKITGTEVIMSEMFAGEKGLTREDGVDALAIKSMLLYLRRNLQKCFALLIISLFAVSLLAPSSASANPDLGQPVYEPTFLTSVHIGGMLDVHNESLILDTLKDAVKDNVDVFIIQLDSDAVAGADINNIAKQISNAKYITTAVWVGPASVVYSKDLQPILDASDFVGAADSKLVKKTGASIKASSFREFIAALDNKNNDGHTIETGCSKSEVKEKELGCDDIKFEGREKFQLTVAPKFEKLSPISNLGHALISPSFAVGLLVLGLCLLAFEFYAASVGVAGIAGILSLIMSIYGLGYLPTNWWAIGLVVLGVLAMVIDVQAGGIGFYTALGAVFIPLGTIFATSRSDNFGTSFSGTAIILVMALLFMTGAIPSLIRTRFGTPTIGREDFIGEEATADGDVDPEGNVKLRGASWKARTNHSTPIKDGEKCKVIKIEGIILEVEPLVGAARDHREGRSKSSS